jgi:hypothetical protein
VREVYSGAVGAERRPATQQTIEIRQQAFSNTEAGQEKRGQPPNPTPNSESLIPIPALHSRLDDLFSPMRRRGSFADDQHGAETSD